MIVDNTTASAYTITYPDQNALEPLLEITKQLAPVSISFCVLALLLNIFIIYHYFPTRTRVLSCLFIIIASADIVTALGHFILYITTLPSKLKDYYNQGFNGAGLGLLLYHGLGVFGGNCSIFYNVILSTLRTYVIVARIPSISTRAVVISVAIHFLCWFTLLIFDMLAIVQSISMGFTYTIFLMDFVRSFIGNVLCLFIKNQEHTNECVTVSTVLLTIISHMLPVILVLVSMFVQIVALLWGRTGDPERRHVTTTIVLLSLLFCACHSFTALYYLSWIKFVAVSLSKLGRNGFIAAKILPLSNAVLAPAILIFRSENLSREFVGVFRKLGGFVKRMCCVQADEEERERLLDN